jgi:hypothetical protein
MLEVAIISIKCALRDDYPEFAEFFEARSWEKKEESENNEEQKEESDIDEDKSL